MADDDAGAGAQRRGGADPGGAGVQPAGEPAPEEGPAHGSVRYTRRRVLVLGGAFAAGLVAVVAGLKAFGGSAADKVGGAVGDQFGSFPVRSIDPVPDVPPDQWVVKVDGLVDSPLTVDHTAWLSLQRVQRDGRTSTAWRAGASTPCAGAAWRRPYCSTRRG